MARRRFEPLDQGRWAPVDHTHSEPDETPITGGPGVHDHDGTYSPAVHTHPYADEVHTHVEAEITDLGPYAADVHSHVEADISDLNHVSTLDELTDVNAPTPADGHVLTFDTATGQWIPAAGGGGGASVIDDLTDVDTATTPPTDGQALIWDEGSGLWVPGDVAAGGGGGMVHLHTETIGSSVASVTITGISQSYRDLLVLVEVVTADTADQDFPQLRLGDASIDSGSNYSQRVNYEGNSSGGIDGDSLTTFQHGPTAKGAGDGTANAKGQARFLLRGYAESAWTFVEMWGHKSGDSYYYADGGGVWKNTDPVSRIEVSADGGNLTGGRILVFGIGDAL